jgi:anti-sigma B factor antagonist
MKPTLSPKPSPITGGTEMTQADTRLDVRRASETTAVIGIQGELTGATEALLMDAYARASDSMTRTVILDFTGLEYMNSTGIGLLVTLIVRAQRQRQRILAFGLSDHYRQILSLTRLDEAIAVVESEEAAVAAG